MNIYRFMIVAVAILFLTSCKLHIIVPQGGSVDTVSGAYNCNTGETCDIDVVDFFFKETFIARPGNGYEFSFWKKGDRRFCGRESGNCLVTTEGFETNQNLADVMVSFFESDEVFYLQPVFKATGDITLPLTAQNIQGQWVGEVDITAKAFPDVSCGWTLKSDVSGGIGKFTATLMYDNAPIDCVTFRSEANFSIVDNGSALLVDIYFNSSSLIGPTELKFAPGEVGELRSVVEFTYDGFTVIQTTTFRRP
tara:strand:+ start:197624 stop:198376 length:753 start_codon:yes stop_codon:yes gene_type:complete